VALTNDIFHSEMILPGIIWTIEVNLDVERLPSADNQLVVVILVCVVINFVGVPFLLEQVNTCDIKVVWTRREENS
jgi:hypothetical protein